jgi:H+-transporting ATPase
MIEAAVILSLLVRDWTDFGIIMVLLVANAVVSFWEEYQAGNAIAALKARLALEARVKRDGQWRTIPARELVPGDLTSCETESSEPDRAQVQAPRPCR